MQEVVEERRHPRNCSPELPLASAQIFVSLQPNEPGACGTERTQTRSWVIRISLLGRRGRETGCEDSVSCSILGSGHGLRGSKDLEYSATYKTALGNKGFSLNATAPVGHSTMSLRDYNC